MRVNADLSDGFSVIVGVHQVSSMIPPLLITVLEALSKDERTVRPWKLLYDHDQVLVTSQTEAMEIFQRWKQEMKSKGLKVIVDKTKIMIP